MGLGSLGSAAFHEEEPCAVDPWSFYKSTAVCKDVHSYQGCFGNDGDRDDAPGP